MNHLLSEGLKVDNAIGPASLNGANTGRYFRLDDWRKGLFVVEIGAMAAGATSALQVMEAQDAVPTNAQAITNLTDTITANVHVAEATITCAAIAVADEITINGVTFTAAAAADYPNNVFDQSGNNDADAASLAAAINHAAGVPGITATANGAVVTLTVTEPGDLYITVANAAVTMTVATVRAVAYLEVDASMLDTADDYTHVALRVTNSAAMVTGATLLRGSGRYNPPAQWVAASKVDTSV